MIRFVILMILAVPLCSQSLGVAPNDARAMPPPWGPNPAPRGPPVELYATGEGQTQARLAVGIGGQEAEVLESGSFPGFVEFLRVKLRIPQAEVGSCRTRIS